jgi:type II secretory pathway pseudopilin PulG
MATPYPPAAPPVSRTSGLAIAGFVCAFFCSVLGLILSIMGHNECKRSGGTIRGEGLALAGIIISSVVLALSALGIVAAIAIPSFMGYMDKGRRTEPELMLLQIQHGAQRYAIEHGELPRGSAPLTPATPCCAGPDHKCFDMQSWEPFAWQQLDFSIDRPHRFQYSYESDGKTFTARAVGDVDCDGSAVTYELRGVIGASGTAVFEKRGPIGQD